jgi:hypothetical protein
MIPLRREAGEREGARRSPSEGGKGEVVVQHE